MDQWNRIETQITNRSVYNGMIFNKGVRLHNGERTASLFGIGKTGYAHTRE